MKNLAVFFVLLSISSCGEPPPKPNEPFYCKIDGKRFRPDNGGDAFFEALLAQRDEKYKLFYITAYAQGGETVGIATKFNDLKDFQVKTYSMNEEFKGNYTSKSENINGIGIQTDYETFSKSGFVTFTKIDTLKQIVSGVFEFKAKDKKSEKIISITKGQFNDVFFY
jgi:hypothetical protein